MQILGRMNHSVRTAFQQLTVMDDDDGLVYVFGDSEDEIESLVEGALQRTPQGKDIVIGSTVKPGFIKRLQEKTNIRAYYNPMFADPGFGVEKALNDIKEAPMVLIGGYPPDVGSGGKAVIEKIIKLHDGFTVKQKIPRVVLDVPEAEIAKLVHSSYKALNISFANMVGDIAEEQGMKGEEILRAFPPNGWRPYIGYGYSGTTLRDETAKLASVVGPEAKFLLNATNEWNEIHTGRMAERMLLARPSQKGVATAGDGQVNDPCFIFQDVCHHTNGDPMGLENLQILNIANRIAKVKRTVVIKDTPVVLDAVRKHYGDVFHYESL